MFTMELILMHIFSKSLAVIEVAVEILLQIQVYFFIGLSQIKVTSNQLQNKMQLHGMKKSEW